MLHRIQYIAVQKIAVLSDDFALHYGEVSHRKTILQTPTRLGLPLETNLKETKRLKTSMACLMGLLVIRQLFGHSIVHAEVREWIFSFYNTVLQQHLFVHCCYSLVIFCEIRIMYELHVENWCLQIVSLDWLFLLFPIMCRYVPGICSMCLVEKYMRCKITFRQNFEFRE